MKNMEKLYIRLALVYAVCAMIFGVFYREFTRFNDFTGKTNLSVMHTHYFMLGMFFFLVLMLLERSFGFSGQKNIKRDLVIYQTGLNITGAALLARGLTQILNPDPSGALDASLSGVAGIGHILLGIGLLLILIKVKRSV